MSADKSRAEVWADMIEASAPGAAAELRRIPALEAERDQLRIEVGRLQECVRLLTERSDRENAERDQLRAEVEALRADAERLDFIAKRAKSDPKMDGQHVWWPTTFNNALRGPTLRDAIDAARKQQ